MRIIALIIGLLFGSFGSVLLIRFSKKVDKETIKGILRGRSTCPKCGATLKARNLIPLVSFFMQKGKCDQCKQSISPLYPVLEIGSAIIFVLSFLAFPHAGIGTIIFRCAVNRLFFLIIVYDIMKYELHVPLRSMLACIIILPQLFGRGNYFQAGLSMLLFVIVFLLIFRGAKRYVKKRYGQSQEGFGQGDVYLAGTIGLLMPFILQQQYLPFDRSTVSSILLLFIILSSLLGILFRLIIYLIKRWTPNMRINTVSPLFRDKILIPFIPAMIVAFRLLLRKAGFFISLAFPLG